MINLLVVCFFNKKYFLAMLEMGYLSGAGQPMMGCFSGSAALTAFVGTILLNKNSSSKVRDVV